MGMTRLKINRPMKKTYFTIKVVSRFLREKAHTIRFWMKEFRIETGRSRGNYRLFTREDICKLKKIRELIRVDEYTINGAIKKLKI